MHTSPPSTPRGQALVLIVLAAVGLFAFAALAIDGSAVFSDRRHSQNASDTAAFAAALALTRNPTSNWQQAGIDRASSNGFDESDGVTEVYVHLCSVALSTDDGIALVCEGLPSGADPSEYVHVYIKSVVNLTFARVIGWQQMINRTDAVVHAAPIDIDEWFNGKAIVSTKKDCPKPGDNYVPLVLGGNGTTVINNSGFFVNSSCEPAMKDDGNSNTIKTSEGVCVYGGVPGSVSGFQNLSGAPLPPDAHCGEQIEITDYWMPDSDPSLLASYCSQKGDISGSGGDYVATPGWFNKTDNKTFPDANPAGTLKLTKGVYCLYNGIDINSNWTITTDLDGDGPDADEGVFLYIIGGDVKFNGGPSIELHPMTSTSGGFNSRLLNYLIFVPASHEATITLNGNSGSIFSGEILAPSSHITLDGGASGDSFTLSTQIIGYDTTITGNGTLNIMYDPDKLPPAIIMPKLAPTE